jgi:hypothetical protein
MKGGNAMLRISASVVKAAKAANQKQPELTAVPGELGHYTSNAATSSSQAPRTAHGSAPKTGIVPVQASGGMSPEGSSNQLQELLLQHARLVQAANDIQRGMRDIRTTGEEGAKNASYAAVWAATLMTADIIRCGVAATYRSAERQFEAQDRALEKANKYLGYLRVFGMKPIATRKDVLGQLDDDAARKMAEYARDVREAREKLRAILRKKPPRWVDQLINCGIVMTEDAAMILETGSLQSRIYHNTEYNLAQTQAKYDMIRRHMQKVEEAIGRLLEEYEMRARTA